MYCLLYLRGSAVMVTIIAIAKPSQTLNETGEGPFPARTGDDAFVAVRQ